MRAAFLVILIAGCASDGPEQRQGVIGLDSGSRRDQLMLAQALDEASSRGAMALADQINGRSVSLALQKGAKPGAALLANLLERDLVRAGALNVQRQSKGAVQLRVLLKAHGLEQTPLGDDVEITAFVDVDLRLLDAQGKQLQQVSLRVQKVERVDGRGFRSKIEGAGHDARPAKPAAQPAKRAARPAKPAARPAKRAKRKALSNRRNAEAQARRDAEEARTAAQRESDQRAEEEVRLAARASIEERRADEEAEARVEADRVEADRRARRSDPDEVPKARQPRPQLDHATHCADDEQILFSCKVRGSQIVSVCASEVLERRRGWLQYRFGKAKNVVRMYPEDRSVSRASFTYAQEQSGESLGVQKVSWGHEKRGYQVWVRQVDPFAEETKAAAGFKLFRSGKLHRDWKCVSEYVEDLRSLDGVVLDPE
jgi:hypothetical protein